MYLKDALSFSVCIEDRPRLFTEAFLKNLHKLYCFLNVFFTSLYQISINYMKNLIYSLSFFLLFSFIASNIMAQTRTIGLFQNSAQSFNGYTLFAPLSNTKTYLIDNCGKEIHSWTSSYSPGNSVYLLEDGTLLRTGKIDNALFTMGGKGGIIERIDKNNTILWSYSIIDSTQCQHHDIEYLPNGNILAIVWDNKTEAEAIANGRNPSTVNNYLWSEKIVEIDPTNDSIVWEWYVWDHLIQDFSTGQSNFGIVGNHPELIDINFTNMGATEDWLHINAIDYNADLDQIVLSNHNFSEIWIIDHSTTTIEAAGHSGGNSSKGGDLLFRWGNPRTYKHGVFADQVFFGQHDANWIKSGYPGEDMIIVYNNGFNRPGDNYSSVDVLAPVQNVSGEYMLHIDSSYLPLTHSWQYIASTPTDFYSAAISGATRQINGNTLICEGNSGRFFEVDSLGNTVWEYINPVVAIGPLSQGDPPTANSVFRSYRYAPDYAGLQTYDLTAGDPIELNPLPDSCEIYSGIYENNIGNLFNIYPIPTTDKLFIKHNSNFDPHKAVLIEIFDCKGVNVLSTCINIDNTELDVSILKPGIYILSIQSDNYLQNIKIIIE